LYARGKLFCLFGAAARGVRYLASAIHDLTILKKSFSYLFEELFKTNKDYVKKLKDELIC